MKTVTVFGNLVEETDNLAVSLVPELKQKFPEMDFIMADPTENIQPLSDPWIILDVAVGISEVVVVTDLKHLDYVKGASVHDYDVYMDLRIKEKLGQLPQIKIILIPNEWEKQSALTALMPLFSQF